jgi:RNAse (barnase) inhibitor barstar
MDQDSSIVDVSGITAKSQLMDLFRERWEFPDWTGRNWDAFEDTITGIVAIPRHVTLANWSQLEQALPRDARILHEILDDFARTETEAGRPMAVEYRG